MRVVLTAEASAELREATAWYTARSRMVGRRFVDAYKHGRGLIAEAPARWMEIEPGIRSLRLERYPYSLIYVVEDNLALVLAVMHQRQHPDTWRDR
ncbi:MAG: type II toxin-antitoxin system RelE/ParE family toxin [Nannocystaceae bacterium]